MNKVKELYIPDATVFIDMMNGETQEQAENRIKLMLKKIGVRIVIWKNGRVQDKEEIPVEPKKTEEPGTQAAP